MITGLNVAYSIAVLFLAASGLAVIFGLMRVINFAHGELMMLGAFTALAIGSISSFWIGLIAAPILVGLGSIVVEIGLIRRFYERPLETILATFGLAIVLREVVTLIAGPDFRTVDEPLPGAVELFGVSYPAYRVFLIAIAVALGLLLAAALLYTRFGLRIRAVVENRGLAAGLGVNVAGAYRLTFGAGAALAALAGALLAPTVAVHPGMGTDFIVGAFLTVIVGGAASAAGLALAAALLGATDSLVTHFWSATAGTIGILVVAVLLMRLRPDGILAGPLR